MAADWIKMTSDVSDKPEVHQLASILHIDPDAVVGKLFRVWSWFDKNTIDGHAVGVTFVLIDRIGFCDGLGKAMISVGWLATDDQTMWIPNFERHNGETAKKRALASKRKQLERSRSYGNETEEGQISRSERDKCVTREEKRREDKETNTFVDSDAVNQESAVVDQADLEDKINRLPACPHQKILAIYSNELPALAQPRAWEGARAAALQARWKFVLTHKRPNGEPYATDLESGLDFFRRLFEYIRTKCPHLNGVNNREWQADLAWIVKAENFLKIIEGKYEVAA